MNSEDGISFSYDREREDININYKTLPRRTVKNWTWKEWTKEIFNWLGILLGIAVFIFYVLYNSYII